MTPLFVETKSRLEWHPISKMLLDNFGDDEAMLGELSASWRKRSWSNSPIPYYEKQLSLLQQLSDHSLPSVRKWQAHNVEWVQERIELERMAEEE
jgi:hypothetical protein